jgi:peroxiredoxin
VLRVGERAPSFRLSDLDGREHALDQALASGPALLVFWKSGCAICDLIFPYLGRLAEAYPQEGWSLWAVSQDGVEAARAFAQKHRTPFDVLVDGEGWPASRAYDPDATPTLFLVGADGVIEQTSVGFSKADLNEVSRRLAERLETAPVEVAPADDGQPDFRPG